MGEPSQATTSYKMPPFTCKDWKIENIFSISANFKAVVRISALEYSQAEIHELILAHEILGVPLIVGDLHRIASWNAEILTPDWLLNNVAEETMPVRDIWNYKDDQMTFEAFLAYARGAPKHATDTETERLYGKDAPCPDAWRLWLHSESIPTRVEPLGEGDLFQYLPDDECPETLMTYFGIGDTFTPCHKDPCASQGQNLMTYAEPDASSFWFFTPSSQSYAAARHFTREPRVELDWEATFLYPEQFAQIPGPVYVCEQKLGDLVLVPRRSCHQVVNKGGLTIKTSWSRMTPDSLNEAVQEECPIYRRVCRPEVYRTKLLCYQTINHFTDLVSREYENPAAEGAINRGLDILRKLIPLLDDILISEWEPSHATITRYTRSQIPVCDFCGADIFQSFLECPSCLDFEAGAESTYQICATCYVEGRSCRCRVMKPMQRWSFETLLDNRNRAAALIHQHLAVGILNEEFLNAAASNRVFAAAFNLWRKREKPLSKTTGRCSLPENYGGAHDTPWDNRAHCSGCNRGFCHKHSLLIRRSHASDDILDSKGPRAMTYHAHHIFRKPAGAPPSPPNDKELFNAAFGSTYGLPMRIRDQPTPTRSIGDLKPSLRLAWAAITFTDCRPIDAERSIVGWYDHKPPKEPQDLTETPVKTEPHDPFHFQKSDDEGFSSIPKKTGKKRRRTSPGQPSAAFQNEADPARQHVSPHHRLLASEDEDIKPLMEAGRFISLGLRTRHSLPGSMSGSDGDSSRKRRRSGNSGANVQSKAEFAKEGPSHRSDKSNGVSRQSSISASAAGSVPMHKSGPSRVSGEAWTARESLYDERDPLAPVEASSTPHNDIPATSSSPSRDSIIGVYSTLYRALLSEQQNLSDAGRTTINGALEQMSEMFGVRPLDIILQEPPKLKPASSSAQASISSGSSHSTPLKNRLTGLSEGSPSQPSPNRARHLFPSSS